MKPKTIRGKVAGESFRRWALFRRLSSGRLSALPVVFASKAQALENREDDEVVRLVEIRVVMTPFARDL
jgi:hypothetical protein